MASVVLGRVGSTVEVRSGVCVKSGRATREQVIARGSTTPGWVHVLLIFTIIGWLFATAMASRRYRITVPFAHAAHDRWRRLNRVAWVLGVAGVIAAIAAGQAGRAGAWLLLGVTATGLVLGLVNAHINNIGVRRDRDGDLVLVRVHPAAAAAMVEADRALA